MFSTKELAEAVAVTVKAHIEQLQAPLLRRIDDLEKRLEGAALSGSVDSLVSSLAALSADLALIKAAAQESDPVEQKGTESLTLKVGDLGPEVFDAIAERTKEMVQELEVSVDDVIKAATDHVDKRIAELPTPKDVSDGVGLAGALIDRGGNLVITLTNGETKELGSVVGQDGKDADMDALKAHIDARIAELPTPKDGKDGFSLDDFDVNMQEDGRTVELSFTQGDRREVYELAFPAMIYRGVYQEGRAYDQGDTVTFGGSLWHCNSETDTKPADGSKAWTLATKRGRDGKDFKGPEAKSIEKVKI